MPKPLNLIVACAENRIIGRAARRPFRPPQRRLATSPDSTRCLAKVHN